MSTLLVDDKGCGCKRTHTYTHFDDTEFTEISVKMGVCAASVCGKNKLRGRRNDILCTKMSKDALETVKLLIYYTHTKLRTHINTAAIQLDVVDKNVKVYGK